MFYASKYKHHKVYCLSHFSVYNSVALITFTSYSRQLCMFFKKLITPNRNSIAPKKWLPLLSRLPVSSAFSIYLPVLYPTYRWNDIFDFLMPGLFSCIVFGCILYKNFTFWIMDNKEWMDDYTNCSGCISLIWNAWTFQLKCVPAFQFFELWNICICTMRYLEHWTLVNYKIHLFRIHLIHRE